MHTNAKRLYKETCRRSEILPKLLKSSEGKETSWPKMLQFRGAAPGLNCCKVPRGGPLA